MSKIHYYDVGAVEMMLDGADVQGVGTGEKAAVVQELSRRGYTLAQLTAKVGVTERTVLRMRAYRVEPMPEVEEFDLTDERAQALEVMAATAMQLACDVRDDATAAWDALLHMEPQHLRELCMTLGCMVPVDFTVKQLLGWVDQEAPLRAVG